MRPGIHPAHVTETVTSLRGGAIKLTAAVSKGWEAAHVNVDIWGQLNGAGNPLYLPRDPDKSVAKYGGVDGYLKSPARGLLHHITIGQYLGFMMRARKHFGRCSKG